MAKAAVERAFVETGREPTRASRRTKKPRAKPVQTRTPEQIAALVERFYGAVCKMPGETMVVLAKRLGVASKELKLPAERLRRAGRVRGVGQKSHLKYFPMVSETNAREEVTA